jgi:RNA 2',3'-cyclic 3'-phosphodiesterase
LSASATDAVRLFVALDLPAAVRGALHAWAVSLDDPSLRVIAPESLHVTLLFLGESEPVALPEAGAAPALAVGRPRRTPRFLAVSLDDVSGRAAELQRAVVATAGREPETRPFWPHVTVARPRDGRGRAPRGPLPAPPALEFAGEALTLYRSHLGRGAGGAVSYEPVTSAPFSTLS